MSIERRVFIAGGEWLYYKFYCGVRMADMILTDIIDPLATQLLEEKFIDKWFFIRYWDPDFHLRIRFHLCEVGNIGMVVQELHKLIQPLVTDEVVYKVQIDTYVRELERYGEETIPIIESLFYQQSLLIVKMIYLFDDEKLFFLGILRAVDQLLNSFGYDNKQKMVLTTQNAEGYKKEFQADKVLTKQMDKKYRSLKDDIVWAISSRGQDEWMIIDEYKDKMEDDINNILYYYNNNQMKVSGAGLISSLIHMLINRAFRSRQRFHELVCYDFLRRYYMTECKRGSYFFEP